MQLFGALGDGIYDFLPQILGGIQNGLGALALSLLDPAIEGVGLEVQLCHGLAGGDFAALPPLQNLVEQLLVDFNGLAPLGGGILLPAVQGQCRLQQPYGALPLRRAGIQSLVHCPEADAPGL